MSSALARVYAHPPTGETVLPILQSALPYSLPLHGRLNFHHRSAASQILATFPPPASLSNGDDHIGNKCYAIAYLDRTRRPETEAWLFLSGEIPARCELSSPARSCVACKAAVIALLIAMAKSDVPDSIHDLQAMSTAVPALKRALLGKELLLGAVHEAGAQIIKDEIARPEADAINARVDHPYLKHLFQPSTLPEAMNLPKGFHWGEVRRDDYILVRSRTSIPRQDATLALLPSLAIFKNTETNDAPVAWAFLGVDGSLTSLHTEPEFRGRGLAKALTSKLFMEGGFGRNESNFAEAGTWFHADVALDNASSRGVCRALGGTEAWIVYWLRIDLDDLDHLVC